MEGSSSSEEGRKDASACRSEARRFRLTKQDRIRKSSEFQRITRGTAPYRTAHFLVWISKNDLARNRLGVAVGRRVGNACARNRIKRRLREFFRLNRDKIPPETDVVIAASRGAQDLDTRRLFDELEGFFKRSFRPSDDGFSRE